jgi:hypothetical protein
MTNQFAHEFTELFKALTGLESLSSGAVVAWFLLGFVTFLGSKRGPLVKYVAARPRLARFFGFLAAVGMNWNKAEALARSALEPKKP